MADDEQVMSIDIRDIARQAVAAMLMNLAYKMHPRMVRSLMHATVHREHEQAAIAQQQAEDAARIARAHVGMDPN